MLFLTTAQAELPLPAVNVVVVGEAGPVARGGEDDDLVDEAEGAGDLADDVAGGGGAADLALVEPDAVAAGAGGGGGG